MLKKALAESIKAKQRFIQTHSVDLELAAEAMTRQLQRGHRILICGNGGSASDSQHFAAELTGRFKKERNALAAIALTTDASALTAIANDYDYGYVFARQVEALACPGDWLIAISTSGNSLNVLKAARAAKKRGCKVLGLTGNTGGKLKKLSDICLNVSATSNTARIQETHIFALHCLAELIEESF